jgi:hypothetical protein
MGMGLSQIRFLSGIVVVALVLLFAFDVIGMWTFIVLIVVEAAVTAGLSFRILRNQRVHAEPPATLQERIDRE